MPCRLVFPNRRVRNNVALRCTTLTLRLAWDESPMSHHSQRRSITSQQLIRSNDAAYFFLISKSDDFTQCKIVAFRIYSFYSFFLLLQESHIQFARFQENNQQFVTDFRIRINFFVTKQGNLLLAVCHFVHFRAVGHGRNRAVFLYLQAAHNRTKFH